MRRLASAVASCLLVIAVLATMPIPQAVAGTYTCAAGAYVSGTANSYADFITDFYRPGAIVSTASFVYDGLTSWHFPTTASRSSDGNWVRVDAQNNYNGVTLSYRGWLNYQYSR